MTFMGRVVRSTEAGMAIHLKCDDSSWRFRSSFIDIARTPSAMPPSMVVRCVSDGGEDNDYRALHEAWQKARISLSDADHQAFITEMLKRKRLDYALEQYRRLQEEEPQSEIAARYLKQIGTILGFYTLQRAPEVSASSDNILKRSIFLIMVGAVCLALGGWLIQTKLTTPAPSIAWRATEPVGYHALMGRYSAARALLLLGLSIWGCECGEGTGFTKVVPVLEVESALTFGEVPIGATKRILLEVTNSGTAEMTISAVDAMMPFSAELESEVVPPGGKTTIDVAFKPTLNGAAARPAAHHVQRGQRPADHRVAQRAGGRGLHDHRTRAGGVHQHHRGDGARRGDRDRELRGWRTSRAPSWRSASQGRSTSA